MSENLSKYERLIENLSILENRNPDLKRMIAFLDMWLNQFVQGCDSAVLCTIVSKDECVKEATSESEIQIDNGVNNVSDTESIEKTSSSTENQAETKSCEKQENHISTNVTSSVVGENGEPSVDLSVSDSRTFDMESDELARAQIAGTVSVNTWREEDILQLEKRLVLKIEASRWALERDRLLKNSVNFQEVIEPRDHALLARARELTNCYLWMNNPETAPIIATETYQMLAEAYSAAACCVGFMRELVSLVDRSPKSEILSRILRDALYITATAQSALRRVTYDVSGREDQDQIRIHRWLTYLTKRYCIYVNRHMKKDSLAPKDRIYVIPEYIGRLRKEVEKLGQRQKILTAGFRRIQYHAVRIQEQNGGEHDWMKIIGTVDELVDAGIPANDERFAELLRGILPTLPAVPSYKEHPFFINVLMELDFWRENEAEKALVEQEMSERPPQPTVTADGECAEKYASVWDEMERCVVPKPVVGEGANLENQGGAAENSITVESGEERVAENWGGNRVAPREMENHGFVNRPGMYRESIYRAVPETGFQGRLAESEGGNYVPPMGRSERRTAWDRGVEMVETRPTFANFSSVKRSQGFGSGILGSRELEPERRNMAYRTAPETGNRPVNSGYSRFATHPGIPSYDNVVAKRAHEMHREPEVTTLEPAPQVEVSSEELLAQVQKMVGTKKILLLDGNSDSPFWMPFVENLNGMVVFAGEEYTESEIKLAQLVHPGDVAVVMLVDGTVTSNNRNVEFYCRRYDKPLLRVGRELDLASFARQVKAAIALSSLSGNS